MFGVIESEQQAATPTLLYRELLARVHAKLARECGVTSDHAMDAAFGRSVGEWPAFVDTAPALAYLSRHYKLVILSNVDHESFAGSQVRLGVAFDAIYTAEDIGSYKPDARNFEYLLHALAALGYGKSAILHTAQSLYHDHVPAERVGLARCWINRRGDRGNGSGATKAVDQPPMVDFEYPTLAAMVDAHRREVGAVV